VYIHAFHFCLSVNPASTETNSAITVAGLGAGQRAALRRLDPTMVGQGAALKQLDPEPVVVEVAKPKLGSGDDCEVIIINESYYKDEEEVIINDRRYSIFGSMRVLDDGSIVAGVPTNLNDPSCKHPVNQCFNIHNYCG